MATRNNGGKQTDKTTKTQSTPMTADAVEQRVVAFAEQLGRIVGTVQAKAEGWMDRETLNQQIAGVRDSAAELLEQLSDGVTAMTKSAKKAGAGAASAASKARSKGRSGGVVDAPGKKHRKPMPADPRAMAAEAKRSTMRAGKAMMKTVKLRGRG